MEEQNNRIDILLLLTAAILGFAIVATIVVFMIAGPRTVPSIDEKGNVVPVDPPEEEKQTDFNILVAGTDVASNSSDVIMIVHIDTEEGTLSILQIPRDTYVNGTATGYEGITKINAIYPREFALNRSLGYSTSNAKKHAMENLTAFYENAFGIEIDDYILINTSCFRSIVDAVGGIWFDVPYDMYYEDPYQDLYIDLKAGYQLLDGEKAEQLIRYREAIRADIGRTEVRADFIKAMATQVKANMSITKLLGITPDLLSNMITSVSLTDALSYVQMVYGLNLDDVVIRTLSGSVVWDESRLVWTSEYYLNKMSAWKDVNELLCGKNSQVSYEDFDKNGYFLNEDNPNAVDYYTREDLQ